MKEIIIGFLIMFLTIVVLCFIMKLEKEKLKKAEEELESAIKQNEINASYNREMKKNEEKMAEIRNGNKLDNFNSGIERMQELSKKGKQRNS